MIRKLVLFAFVMAVFSLPGVTFAQTRGGSVEDINIADIPADSIVVISRDNDTDVPGYVHEKYVFVSPDCIGGAQIVDHSGTPIDPKDPNLLRSEAISCARDMLDSTESSD